MSVKAILLGAATALLVWCGVGGAIGLLLGLDRATDPAWREWTAYLAVLAAGGFAGGGVAARISRRRPYLHAIVAVLGVIAFKFGLAMALRVFVSTEETMVPDVPLWVEVTAWILFGATLGGSPLLGARYALSKPRPPREPAFEHPRERAGF